MALRVRAAKGPLQGELRPPGDKSITHRALIMASLASGESRLTGCLEAADTRATRHALEQLGAVFTQTGTALTVSGLGGRLTAPTAELDMGNSGTAMRLLAGVLAGQAFDSVLVGDASLSRRPMQRIITPLQRMGAHIESGDGGRAPLRIRGRALHGIEYASPVASAQVKSCVLLAGLYAAGRSCVREPQMSRDHTERMLPAFGVPLPAPCCVDGGCRLVAANLEIPADPSSAAFLAAAALMVEGSEVVLQRVGLNPTRTGFFRAIEAMGADMEIGPEKDLGTEPVGTVRVRHGKCLRGIELPTAWVPSMIDEMPVLMALAARAEGVTRVRGAAELRVKESDRLSVMTHGLRSLGVEVNEYPDGFDITGAPSLRSAELDGRDDHRCAMSFALLGLLAPDGVTVRGAEFIETSYPGFVAHMQALGAAIEHRADSG